MTNGKPVGVVLFQLGGPDSLETVEPFLYNLFSDPDIIDLPLAFLFRKPLARFIARRRAPKVQNYYRRIGGRSPILKITMRQALALERQLQKTTNARVYAAMRYWHPMTDAVVQRMQQDEVDRIVLLPLYPQYSKATTGSSLNEWNRVVEKKGIGRRMVNVVKEYCTHPLYVAALVERIGIALKRVPVRDRGKVHLVFSAHGTPVKFVEQGDPYEQQVVRTYKSVLETGKFDLPHRLCYQSKVGPEKWLEPSLGDTIRKLAAERVTHLIVVPIAFVSDHVETLWEINMETKEEAKALGIPYFDITPALNSSPLFVGALADLVGKELSG